MAHFWRKVAIIGFIATNSPLLAGKSDDGEVTAAIGKAAATLHAEVHTGPAHLAAAREAAQILAGLDPSLREKVIGAAGSAARGVQR